MKLPRIPSVLLATSVLLGLADAATTPSDPFASGPSWTDEVLATKPLRLEICFAETDQPLPTVASNGFPAGTTGATSVVTPEFLQAATQLHIAVAATDEGGVTLPGLASATYRLKPGGKAEIKLSVRIDGNLREIDTRLTLGENWTVLGGLNRTEVRTDTAGVSTETRKGFYAALRLVPFHP